MLSLHERDSPGKVDLILRALLVKCCDCFKIAIQKLRPWLDSRGQSTLIPTSHWKKTTGMRNRKFMILHQRTIRASVKSSSTSMLGQEGEQYSAYSLIILSSHIGLKLANFPSFLQHKNRKLGTRKFWIHIRSFSKVSSSTVAGDFADS